MKTIVPLFTTPETYWFWIDHGVPCVKDLLFWISTYYGREAKKVTHKQLNGSFLS